MFIVGASDNPGGLDDCGAAGDLESASGNGGPGRNRDLDSADGRVGPRATVVVSAPVVVVATLMATVLVVQMNLVALEI